MIVINLPDIGNKEIEAVIEVMKSGLLTSGLGAGPKVKEFEENYSKFAGVKHAIAVNTGTAALHAALLAVGIKSGDEVILPSFTFVATAEAIVLAGGKPVFADIDPETYTLSPKAVEKVVTKNTKAIIPVDLYGLPADIKQIREIAVKNDLTIVEDCAQSHGATCEGKPAGAIADIACWSLYAAKNIGTGEGGVVTTDKDELAEKVRMVRTHGEKAKYQSLMLGTNYRMTEIQAAIGIVQLGRLPEFLNKRLKNAYKLNKNLEKTEKIKLPQKLNNRTHSWYLYTVRIKDASEEKRNKIITQMHTNGIGAEAYYPTPINKMTYYREKFGTFDLPETEIAAKQVISLPIHPKVTEEQIDYISETLLSLL
ncbi:MAG: DegT/DnrJ/EryC1/StrS family aminotransferase [Candidatus Bathyarchaeota archaeon]|nr:DegT/DnrJ/EryC1/StrS family aminotransferase [Candidatus Bathyarchaeota archaeon]